MNRMLITGTLLSIIFISFVSCSKQQSPHDVLSENKTFPETDSPVILEITQDARGMWDISGKTLFFRLYKSGTLELESLDYKKKTAGFNKAENVNVLRRSKIENSELQKLISLIDDKNFQKLNGNYERKCCCTDAFLDYKITFQTDNATQSISLAGYCSVDEIVNPQKHDLAGIPTEISSLMATILKYREQPDSSN